MTMFFIQWIIVSFIVAVATGSFIKVAMGDNDV